MNISQCTLVKLNCNIKITINRTTKHGAYIMFFFVYGTFISSTNCKRIV